jgi:actin-related protein
MPGFTKRLKQGLEEATVFAGSSAPVTIPYEVAASSDPRYAAWQGGSMLSELSTFRSMCIDNSSEYDEYGPVMLRRKCWGICL